MPSLGNVFSNLPELCSQDSEFNFNARHFTVNLTFTVGPHTYNYKMTDGHFNHDGKEELSKLSDDLFDLELSSSNKGWSDFLAAMPDRYNHDLQAAELARTVKVTTSNQVANKAFRPALHRIFDVLREALHGNASSSRSGPIKRPQRTSQFDNAVGRYVYLEIEGVEYRVYFEEAGNTENGIPLLCQHTAGTDGRQYRHILEDKTLHEKFHVVSYDLPFHGRSLPPTEVEYWKKEWKLTKSFFMQVPIQLAKALQLEKPVYMGSSIGGMLAIDLAYHFPNEFRAVIGLEAALATSGRERMDKVPEELRTVEDQHGLMRHPRTGGNSNGIWMYGLTGPDSPEPYRREVAWVYSQGAPDVFAGDIYYYDIDHDLRGKAQEIDTSILDVYLLTGEYDWSATPELTEELAKCIKGCYYQKMDGIGHFPMTENPKQFMKYLSPVLDKIVEKSNVGKMSSTAKSGGGKVAVKSKL